MKQLTTTTAVFGPFNHIDVLADRYRCDGADFPFSVIGAATVDNYVPVIPAYDLVGARAALVAKIDADVDLIYEAVVGNRSDEYNAAAADAAAYKAAGYTGTVPASIACWATAKSWTATQATDDILTAASNLMALRDNIRAHRLAKKEAARLAANEAGIATVTAQWSGALAALRVAAGLP